MATGEENAMLRRKSKSKEKVRKLKPMRETVRDLDGMVGKKDGPKASPGGRATEARTKTQISKDLEAKDGQAIRGGTTPSPGGPLPIPYPNSSLK